jgi:hypothetical protein
MTENAAPMVRQVFDDFNRENFPAAYNGTTGASVGRWLGQEFATASLPQVKIAAAASRLVPAAGRLGGLSRRMADGAANGAIGATLTSSGNDDPLYEQAAWGALGGGLWAGASHGAASVIAPRLAPGRKALLEQDHPLTIGQAMGGTVERLENKAAAWPVIGVPIRAAQERGMESAYPGLMRSLNASGDGAPDLRPFPRPVAIDRGASGFMADMAYSEPVQTMLRNAVGGERPQTAGIIGDYLRDEIGHGAFVRGLLSGPR